jgi:hypothetical protein
MGAARLENMRVDEGRIGFGSRYCNAASASEFASEDGSLLCSLMNFVVAETLHRL